MWNKCYSCLDSKLPEGRIRCLGIIQLLCLPSYPLILTSMWSEMGALPLGLPEGENLGFKFSLLPSLSLSLSHTHTHTHTCCEPPNLTPHLDEAVSEGWDPWSGSTARQGCWTPRAATHVHRPLLHLFFSLKSPGGGPIPWPLPLMRATLTRWWRRVSQHQLPWHPLGPGSFLGSGVKEEGVKSKNFAHFPRVCLNINPNCGTSCSAFSRHQGDSWACLALGKLEFCFTFRRRCLQKWQPQQRPNPKWKGARNCPQSPPQNSWNLQLYKYGWNEDLSSNYKR